MHTQSKVLAHIPRGLLMRIVRCLLYLLFVIADIDECVIQRLDFRAAACECVRMRVQALLNGSARA
jgi:hypothetical protein